MASLRSYTLFIHVRLLLDFFARLSNKTMCLLSLSHREKQVSFAQFENFYDTNVKIILFKFYYIIRKRRYRAHVSTEENSVVLRVAIEREPSDQQACGDR